MNSFATFRPPAGRVSYPAWCLIVIGWLLITSPLMVEVVGQDSAGEQTKANQPAKAQAAAGEPADEQPGKYTAAIRLLPDTTAGLVRIPDFPKFCEAFEKTRFGKLLDEPSMQPFIEAQRARAKNYLTPIDSKTGIRLDDLYDIATGEVVIAWLPFEKDKRRPYAMCVIADTRGARAKSEAAMEQIDKDLKTGGATRKDVTHAGQVVRVYSPKRKPGQLKVEQIAITLSDVRIIAADRDTVVTDLLDAIAGHPKGDSISTLPDFKTVLTRSSVAIRKPLQKGGGAIAAEWFAKPFQMGRILREVFNVDRGNEIDIIALLENQGFDALKAAGGIVAIAGERYDLLHRGFVLAPATTDQPSKYEKAARILQLIDTKRAAIPAWVDPKMATFSRLQLRVEDGFWAAESLIDEALGQQKIFRDMIDGIRDDEDGPQIDLAKNVLPNLDDQVILMTDNTTPVAENSERMLVAIRVRDAEAIEKAVRKAMEVEPDTIKLDVVPGVDIWRVHRVESNDSFDTDAFGDLGLGFDEETDQPPPLMTHWAIALVPRGPGSDAPYLMFSSHPDLLVATAKRIQQGGQPGFGSLEEVKTVSDSIKDLGGDEAGHDHVVRMRLSIRAKYYLLRQGLLKDSNSLMVSLYKRLFEEEDKGQPDPVNATKLPPLKQIEQFFPNGGRFVRTAEDGWSLTGFFLK